MRKLLLNINKWIIFTCLLILAIGAMATVIAGYRGLEIPVDGLKLENAPTFVLEILKMYGSVVALTALIILVVGTPLVLFYLLRREIARRQSTPLILIGIAIQAAYLVFSLSDSFSGLKFFTNDTMFFLGMMALDALALLFKKKIN